METLKRSYRVSLAESVRRIREARRLGMSWADAIKTSQLPVIAGGSTWINDLINSCLFGQTVKSQAVAATLNGTAIDCAEAEGTIAMIANVGVVTDGGYTITVEESETSGGTFTAVVLNAVMPELITTNDDQIYTRRFKRSKRFVRAVITESTAGVTGVVIGITFVAMKKATV